MAIQKTTELADGSTADYYKFKKVEEWDQEEKRIVIYFALYRSKALRDAGKAPALTQGCRLRLNGDKFDLYFSVAALTKAASEGKSFVDNAYAAAKAEDVDLFGAGGSGKKFKDATDV